MVNDMSTAIGELKSQNGNTLMKMWSIDVPPCTRPFVRHYHTRFEITVVNSGSGVYTTEKSVYPMREGDVFVFSSNEVHSITKVEASGISITNLHFEPRYINGEFSESFGDSYAMFCFFHAANFSNRIPSESAGILREHHNAIAEEFKKQEEHYSLAIHSHLYFILIELLRKHGYRMLNLPQSSILDFLKVYDYIDKHIDEPLKLSEISALVGITPNYFSHKFKESNGISLWEYITSKRIEKSVKMILDLDNRHTILEIALQCGFNNTVNFNKAFKKLKGFTPAELRKNPKLLFH